MAASTAFSTSATRGGDAIYGLALAFAQEHNNIHLKPIGRQSFYWSGNVPTTSLDEANDEYYFVKFPGNFTLCSFRLLFPAQGAAADFDVVAQTDGGTEQVVIGATAPTTAPIVVAPEFYGSQPAETGWAAFWGARYNVANKFLGIKCAAPGAAPAGTGFQLLLDCFIGEMRGLV